MLFYAAIIRELAVTDYVSNDVFCDVSRLVISCVRKDLVIA